VGLLTAPLSLARLSLRVAEFALSTAAEAARIGTELLEPDRESSRDFARYRAGNGGRPDIDFVAPAEPAVAAPAEPAVAAPAEPAAATADAPPAVPDELIPDHVDEETVLVAEVAEEGAEDGAGAELRVEPPWEGYEEMTAADIRDRLAAATVVEAAAVELYESTGKNRRTVIEAAASALSG
jgi:hypothetical protein